MHKPRLLAVAGVLALLVGACSGGLESPDEALRKDGQPVSPFGYVIEAVPEGYELCGVSVPSALSVSADSEAALYVYGDGQAEDPYQVPLYAVVSLPAGPLEDLDLGETTEVDLGQEKALLGGLDGLVVAVLSGEEGQTLTWRLDDERIAQVVVRGATDVDLVSLAETVEVVDGVAQLPLESLPAGYVDLGDVYQLEGQPQFLFSLDYRQRGADLDGDQITLLGASGGFESMEAFRFRAASSARIVINGNPGVVANIGTVEEPRRLVSWMADDNLILRIFSLTQPADVVVAAAESTTRVDGDQWHDLKAEFDVVGCQG